MVFPPVVRRGLSTQLVKMRAAPASWSRVDVRNTVNPVLMLPWCAVDTGLLTPVQLLLLLKADSSTGNFGDPVRDTSL